MCDLDETHKAEPPVNQSHFSTTPKIEDGEGKKKKSSIDRPADGWMDLQLVSFSAGQVAPLFPFPIRPGCFPG